jgi:hypothetical protein
MSKNDPVSSIIIDGEIAATRSAYEAQMTAARVVYDAAVFNKSIGNCTAEVALMIVFHQVAGEYAERKA